MKLLIFRKKNLTKKDRRLIRHRRIKSKLKRNIRISIFRSNKHLYAQLIDDSQGKTLTSASSLEFRNEKLSGKEKAKKVAELFAERVLKLGIQNFAFDRSGYKYHGRIKIFADTLREKGLKF